MRQPHKEVTTGLVSFEVTRTTMHDPNLALALAQERTTRRWRHDASKSRQLPKLLNARSTLSQTCHMKKSQHKTRSRRQCRRSDPRTARGGGETGWENNHRTSGVRGAACVRRRRTRVDHHVGVGGAREKRRQRADSSQHARQLQHCSRQKWKVNSSQTCKTKSRQRSKANSWRKEQGRLADESVRSAKKEQ